VERLGVESEESGEVEPTGPCDWLIVRDVPATEVAAAELELLLDELTAKTLLASMTPSCTGLQPCGGTPLKAATTTAERLQKRAFPPMNASFIQASVLLFLIEKSVDMVPNTREGAKFW
jgi:hypothetical protein